MPREPLYRCDGPGCKEYGESSRTMHLVLILHNDDVEDDGKPHRRTRTRGFHAWECLVKFVGANA